MTERGLSDPEHLSADIRHEWQSFLGLVPVLDLRPVDPVLYQRCLAAVWLLRGKRTISRKGLQHVTGIDFLTENLNSDLLLAQLVREEILEPIVSSPFDFQIRRRNWTNPESAYAADDRLSLDNPRLPAKRVQQIRKERDDLALQLELPLDVKGKFDLEGEARCNQ